MCDVGFGMRMVFESKERREEMRKREGRKRRGELMRERREKFRGIKNVLFVHTIIYLRWYYSIMPKKFTLFHE